MSSCGEGCSNDLEYNVTQMNGERTPLTVSISQEAAGHVRDFAKQAGKPDSSLRVGVKGGGCSGLTSYCAFTIRTSSSNASTLGLGVVPFWPG